jgi:hypothetical protein
LKVYATNAERAMIEARAESAGMTVSSYLRVLGLNHKPKSIFDHDAVLEMARASGDVGRLGGLLKWLLSEAPAGEVEAKATSLLNEIAEAVRVLREKAGRV